MINQTDTVSPVDAKKCFSSTFFMIPNWLEKRSEKKLDKAALAVNILDSFVVRHEALSC